MTLHELIDSVGMERQLLALNKAQEDCILAKDSPYQTSAADLAFWDAVDDLLLAREANR